MANQQAAATRDLVIQARRLAHQQTSDAEKARLARYADELETRARKLERQADKGP